MQGVAITTTITYTMIMLTNKMKGENMNNVIDSIMLGDLKHNYAAFVDRWGFEEADFRLHRLFGEVWLNNREIVWQWFDKEYIGGRK